jgi:hypothetical protein
LNGQISILLPPRLLAAAFDIPMTKKPGMPDYRLIDVQKKKAAAALPRAPAAGFKPEPAIGMCQ